MYSFEINKTDKTMIAKVSGFFTEEEGKKYITDFQNKVKTIDPSIFSLIVEGSKLSTTSSKAVEGLKNCIRFYMSNGFEKIILVIPDSVTAKMQAQRVGTEVGFKGDYVTSIDEAISISKR